MYNTLDELLHERRLSVSDLSRKTGVSRTTITDIIKGRKNNITFETAKKISACIGCSVSDLFPDIKENASC